VPETKNFRVQQTLQKIKQIFNELLVEEGFTNITVKQILQGAHINRSTFYTYFDNKEDLLNEIEADLFQGLKKISKKLLEQDVKFYSDEEALQTYYHQLVHYIYENRDKFALLAGAKGDPAFISKLFKLDQDIWNQSQTLEELTVPQHYALTGLLTLGTSLINEWAQNDFQETPEEFENILKSMIEPIFLGSLFKKEK
jgi:AcrR family transcriptional regulator